MINGYFRTIGPVVAVPSHILWDLSIFLGDKRDLPPFLGNQEIYLLFLNQYLLRELTTPHIHTHTIVYYQCNMIEENTFQHQIMGPHPTFWGSGSLCCEWQHCDLLWSFSCDVPWSMWSLVVVFQLLLCPFWYCQPSPEETPLWGPVPSVTWYLQCPPAHINSQPSLARGHITHSWWNRPLPCYCLTKLLFQGGHGDKDEGLGLQWCAFLCLRRR